jgi:transcriptional regulator with XRE-family HTH domain
MGNSEMNGIFLELKRAGITAKQVASRLEVTESAVSAWRNRRRAMNPSYKRLISEIVEESKNSDIAPEQQKDSFWNSEVGVAFTILKKAKVSNRKIASRLEVTETTVWSWQSGKRILKLPMKNELLAYAKEVQDISLGIKPEKSDKNIARKKQGCPQNPILLTDKNIARKKQGCPQNPILLSLSSIFIYLKRMLKFGPGKNISKRDLARIRKDVWHKGSNPCKNFFRALLYWNIFLLVCMLIFGLIFGPQFTYHPVYV